MKDNKLLPKILMNLAVFAAGALTGYFFYRLILGCESTNMLYFTAGFKEPVLGSGIAAAVAGGGLIFILRRWCGRENLCAAAGPALLLGTLFCFPASLWSIVIFIAVVSWCVFRVLAVLPYPRFIVSRDKYRIGLILLLLAVLSMGSYMVWLYLRAWHRGYMFVYDWGMFVEPAMNTLRGELMREYWFTRGGSFLGHHLMPGFFIWFTPLLAVFPCPQTIMVLGAVILCGSALLVYYFARLRKLPPFFAAACGFIYLLYPTVANYNLSYGYGFHVIYLFIPVFLLFCCLYERKKWLLAFLVFLFSLTIKETVGAFWVGWGLCQILASLQPSVIRNSEAVRLRRRGVVYSMIGGLYLLACIKIIIPYFAPESQYMYASRFSFGDSLWEIALAPVLQPAAFFAHVFSPKKIMQALLLAVPLLPAILSRPLWVGCGAVLFVFMWMANGGILINLYNQYTVEMSILLCLAFAAALSQALRRGSGFCSGCLAVKLPEINRRHMGWALLGSSLLAVVLSHYMFAESAWGKNRETFEKLARRPDISFVREQALERIPAGALLGADERTGALMLGSKVKIGSLYVNSDCDAYLYDSGAKGIGPGSDFQRKMLEDPELGLTWMHLAGNNRFYLFQRGAESRYPYPFVTMDDAQWQDCGMRISLPENGDLFDVRVQPMQEEDGRISVLFSIRITAALKDFYLINAYISYDDDRKMFYSLPLGYGTVLPEKVKTGDVFHFKGLLPPGTGQLLGAGCVLAKE